CPLVGLGRQWVAGHATGLGPRRDDLGPALRGAGRPRGLAGRRAPWSMGEPARGCPTRRAPRRTAPAASAAPGQPARWAGEGLAERGGGAPGLLRRLARWGWPPVWRLHTGGSWRPTDAPGWRPVARCAPQPGTRGRGTGLAWTRNHMPWTVLARWAEGSQ